MSHRLLASRALYNALMAEGFIFPANCSDIELEFPVNGPLVLRFKTWIDAAQAQQLGRAFVRMGQDDEANS